MKIGMCFPQKSFLNHSYDSFILNIKRLSDGGLCNLDFYTDFFIDNNVDKLLLDLSTLGVGVSFHFNGSKEEIENKLAFIREKLNKNNHNYMTTIVFHGFNYSNKYLDVKKQLEFFNYLSNIGKKYNFKILIETLSKNHPKGNFLGSSFSEIAIFMSNIKSDNFGVCWDIGHSRLNSIENHENLLLPENLIKRVMFVHIHGLLNKEGQFIDHQEKLNLDLIDDEILHLSNAGYNGVYSLEYNTDDFEENIDMHIKNIKKLKNIIKDEV